MRTGDHAVLRTSQSLEGNLLVIMAMHVCNVHYIMRWRPARCDTPTGDIC